MSRHYRMHVRVEGHDPEREHDIHTAMTEQWDFSDPYTYGGEDGQVLTDSGDSNLAGGKGEEEFAARLADAIWKANGGPCKVVVEATYLEDPPTESYFFDEDSPPEVGA